jgi:thioredoxin-dependent peroxiredoxin
MDVVLSPGRKAPGFALSDQQGRTVKLADYKGRMLLIYFYPKADTPGCTTQSCAVRDARQDMKSLNVDVLGISPDAPDAQKKFDDKFSLGFPLLADEDHAVAEAFGVWGDKSMYGKTYKGIIRSSFLIDEKGVVQRAWYKVKPEDTVPLAREALKELAAAP